MDEGGLLGVVLVGRQVPVMRTETTQMGVKGLSRCEAESVVPARFGRHLLSYVRLKSSLAVPQTAGPVLPLHRQPHCSRLRARNLTSLLFFWSEEFRVSPGVNPASPGKPVASPGTLRRVAKVDCRALGAQQP